MELIGNQEACPICEYHPVEKRSSDAGLSVDCPRCGRFFISDTLGADGLVPSIQNAPDSDRARAVISYAIRKGQQSGEWFKLLSYNFDEILKQDYLPNPAEQMDKLLLWVGNNQKSAGEGMRFPLSDALGVMGGQRDSDVVFMIQELHEAGYVSEPRVKNQGASCMRLTLKGWKLFQKLKQGEFDSRKAFMAMPFGESDLDSFFRDHWKPAVKEAGFDLMRVDEKPEAGSITNRMRVEILTSKFVLVELTKSNSGAYWEAGFADGLGKPVIYLCNEDFANKKGTYKDDGGIHFDIAHEQSVYWNPKNMDQAVLDLKNVIRATFPSEAIMTDEVSD